MGKKGILKNNFINSVWSSIKQSAGIVGALCVMCIIMTAATDKFFTGSNFFTVLRQAATVAIPAFGMTFVILLGGIDLSIGSVISLVGSLSAICMSADYGLKWGMGPAIMIGLSAGLLVGLINGLIITKMNIAPFIATLSTTYIVRGASYLLTNARSVAIKNEAYYFIGNGYIFGIPFTVVLMFAFYIIFGLVLYKTRFGRRVYATGGNIQAAKFSGINTDLIQIISYMIIGLLTAVCGIIYSAKLYSGVPTIGEGSELDVIAAVILGGTSFTGGIGTLGGTILGAITLAVISNGLNLLGVSSFWQMVSKGVIIVIAVYIDILKKNNRLNKGI